MKDVITKTKLRDALRTRLAQAANVEEDKVGLDMSLKASPPQGPGSTAASAKGVAG